MDHTDTTTYNDIDWLALWRSSRAMKSWTSKGAEDWNRKAASFSTRTLNSPYVPLFLSRLALSKEYTVLDVGCGPGTLALPLAEHVKSVTAIDYSVNMLKILDDEAAARGLRNVQTRLCSWEDDWQERGIRKADIVIASRSMNVDDLPSALRRADRYARRYVFISDRIAPSPFDPEAFEAIGRTFNSGPDYIYTLNMLYSMKIHPHVEIIELDRDVRHDTLAEAMESYKWMFKELSEEEERKLKRYIQERSTVSGDGSLTLHRTLPPRWALIWWKKHQ